MSAVPLTCRDCGQPASTQRRPTKVCRPCWTVYFAQMKAANAAVCKAKGRGEIPRASEFKCVDCGQQAKDWDHRDYSKPLDVMPVCRSCNIRRGPALYVPRDPSLHKKATADAKRRAAKVAAA